MSSRKVTYTFPLVVGEIDKSLAKKIGKPQGEIVLTKYAVNHIVDRHSKKGTYLPVGEVIRFVKTTIRNANEVFVGNSGNILFGTTGNNYVKITIVSGKTDNKARYRVVTAFPSNEQYIANQKTR
jgi:hypothetical protein